MSDTQNVRSETYLAVYQLLDMAFAERVPAGVAGRLHRAIDQLRTLSAPVQDIRTAEAMSVAIHRLELALLVGDAATAEDARRDLQTLGAAWLQTPVQLTLN